MWHRRLAHISSERLERIINEQLASGLKLNSPAPLARICEPCILGKQHRNPFPKVASHCATAPLERIHSDLHEVSVQTASGYRYWLTFIDDATRFCSIALLKKKSETLAAFKLFKAFAEKQLDRKIKVLRDDKGGEFIGKEWDSFIQAEGIAREHTARATPQQNGVAERRNQQRPG